jgi:multiple sugar transport system substrate-binding protein
LLFATPFEQQGPAFIKSTVRNAGYYRAGMQIFSWEGRLYGLPKDASADVLFYNQTMFRERGVAFPSPDWTWDDFLAAAMMLTQDIDGDGRADIFGAGQPEWDRLVIQNGGKVISDDGTRCLLGEPEAIEALTRWAELHTLYRVTPAPDSVMDTSVWRLFALQRIGMFVARYNGVPILRRSCDFEWDIALPPQGPARRYSAFTGSALAITRQSRNPQAAYTFARWMTSRGMRHVMSFDIPSYVPLAETDEWRDPALLPASKGIAIEVMEHAGPPAIRHPAWAQINDAITPQLNRVSRGVSTVQEAVDRIVPQVNAILARYPAATERDAR